MGNRGFFGFSTGYQEQQSYYLVSGMELWLAADTLSGYTDGQAVATWPDLSGNGRDAVQASATLQPLYRPSVTVFPVLQFDNSNDARVSGCGIATQPYTILAVYASIQATSYNGRAVQGSNNWLLGPRATYHQGYNGALIQGPAVAANTFVCSAFTGDAAGGAFYVNGIYIGSNTNTGAPGTIGLGRGGSASEGLNGYLAEVITYSRVLGLDERVAMEGYLMAKWSVS